ncbi:MAG: site-specific integrase [Ilumatobacteraceae bacterium]
MASIVTKRLSTGKSAYLVRFRTADGVQRGKQFERRRDAERYANLVEVDVAQGSWVDPRLGRITVGEWFERWWPTVTNLRATTRARDEASFRTHVLPRFATTPLGRLDRTALREWVTDLSDPAGKALAPATVVKAAQVFNKVVRAAVEDRVIAHNPVENLPVPAVPRDEMRFLTPDELWKLANTIDPRYRGLVLLGGYGGLRIGEMLALRWQAVDETNSRVNVTSTLTDLAGHLSFGPPKTKASVRMVTLPRFVIDELTANTPGTPSPDALVFRSPEGHTIRPGLLRRRFWTPAVATAQLAPLRIHDLRHTAIALWIAAGANPKQIATRAGHTSVAVVLDRYGHLLPQHDDPLIQALEAQGRSAFL